jgi:long-chain acyl-CoA synthetase
MLSYQKIEKVTVLDEPMEMTTTKKIKRSAV